MAPAADAPRDWGFRVILGLFVVDWLWSTQQGLVFLGWTLPLVTLSVLGAIAFIYTRLRPVPALAEIAKYCSLWICTFLGAGILSYLSASLARPLADDIFAGFDAAFGFHWPSWARFVLDRPVFYIILQIAYGSLGLQVIVSIFIFAACRARGRNEELLLSGTVAAILCCLVSGFLPAVGPWIHFSTAMESVPDFALADPGYITDTLALREGQVRIFEFSQGHGIVCFPSFHTALGILLIYSHRGLRWSFTPVLLMNVVMLFSIPLPGAHYLVDIVGGFAVAAVAILCARLAARSLEAPWTAAFSEAGQQIIHQGLSRR